LWISSRVAQTRAFFKRGDRRIHIASAIADLAAATDQLCGIFQRPVRRRDHLSKRSPETGQGQGLAAEADYRYNLFEKDTL
jgi:hypothetical protein